MKPGMALSYTVQDTPCAGASALAVLLVSTWSRKLDACMLLTSGSEHCGWGSNIGTVEMQQVAGTAREARQAMLWTSG